MGDSGWKSALLDVLVKYNLIEARMTGKVTIDLNMGGITQLKVMPEKILR